MRSRIYIPFFAASVVSAAISFPGLQASAEVFGINDDVWKGPAGALGPVRTLPSGSILVAKQAWFRVTREDLAGGRSSGPTTRAATWQVQL